MPIFYFHPKNSVALKLKEANNGEKSFTYVNRAQLEIKMQSLLTMAGYDLYSNFHTILGPFGQKIEDVISLNLDDPIDRQTHKLRQNSQTPWSYVKVNNGPHLRQVIGYCSTPAQNPFALGPVQMAQRGIISTNFVPTAGGA